MEATTYESAERALGARVGDTALAHCRRVAVTAESLAREYGVDTQAARLAGLLHDWDRDIEHGQLLKKAARYQIPITDVDARWPYLLHAQTAAAELAEALPDIAPEVFAAIARHTVGSSEMTDLDRVVYLADILEPARTYDGVGELRAAIGHVPLDELFARGYESSLARIVKQRRRIHPDSVRVWNALIARGPR